MTTAYVRSELHKGIRIIEFFHPQSNSLPGKILEELAQAIHAAGNEEETKLIILRSAGEKAFCAGASFDELSAIIHTIIRNIIRVKRRNLKNTDPHLGNISELKLTLL